MAIIDITKDIRYKQGIAAAFEKGKKSGIREIQEMIVIKLLATPGHTLPGIAKMLGVSILFVDRVRKEMMG
ncbi:hypothetical protein [Sediminibacterium ginsengisoli]|uniref:Homeodomain-like domain-containing protein n=1 Tax=Sediminibacterium ginsengisoli TaxID=413434 RepID=A0A1T4PKR4_9BACT|nr:hypothetical protein [Sediminibacterium ginsengisoli]SJZ92184.1 hypothetical protein SAMN04488132_10663 [Sediminibacterium ginsengisoli]